MPSTCDRRSGLSGNFQDIIYADDVPGFVAEAINALYGSLYSSLPVLQSGDDRPLDKVSTYVRWHYSDRHAQAKAIFLFRRHGRRIQVINEGMALQQDTIDSFCDYLFATDSRTDQIDFHAIDAPPQASARPCVRGACTEDIIVTLPASADGYLAQLGKSTRKSLKRHLSRARRELPGFSHAVRQGPQVDEQAIRQIVGFNHARMAKKHRTSALDHHSTRQLIGLVRAHGSAGLVSNGDRLCAGTLVMRVGDDMYSLVNAHDPAFDHLGLGNLSRHLMILSAISQGVRRFHLMGGNWRSKRTAMGVLI